MCHWRNEKSLDPAMTGFVDSKGNMIRPFSKDCPGAGDVWVGSDDSRLYGHGRAWADGPTAECYVEGNFFYDRNFWKGGGKTYGPSIGTLTLHFQCTHEGGKCVVSQLRAPTFDIENVPGVTVAITASVDIHGNYYIATFTVVVGQNVSTTQSVTVTAQGATTGGNALVNVAVGSSTVVGGANVTKSFVVYGYCDPDELKRDGAPSQVDSPSKTKDG